MDLKELSTELAHFVQQELTNGAYPSTDDLIVAAVRLLRDQKAALRVPQHSRATPTDTAVSPGAPEDMVHAIQQALAAGEAGRARSLAQDGAQYYPNHVELQKYAQVLAPPATRVVPTSIASRAAVKANGIWLKAHRTEYHGRWVALRHGELVRESNSFETLVAELGDTTGLLLTKVV